MAEVKAVVPESVLKKRKRNEEWALAKKQEIEATKKKNAENRKLIYIRAKQYSKQYEEQVLTIMIPLWCYHFINIHLILF